MTDKASGTLDNPFLRSTLRREYSQSYIPRPIQRQGPRDLIKKRPATLTPQITAQNIPKETEQTPVLQSNPINVATVNEVALVQSRPSLAIPSSNYTQPTHTGLIAELPVLKHWKKNRLHTFLIACALSLFLTGAYVAYLGFRSDNVAKAQAENLTKLANQSQTSSGNSSSSSASPALSTVKLSAAAIANYVVAPNLPRYLRIPSLGVNARVLSVGVNAQGVLGTPNDIYDTAWYNESAQPGQPGATLIDGHISSWTAHGIFYNLKNLKTGDSIQIVRGDGTTSAYKVVKVAVYPASKVDMKAAITPVVAGVSGLNLISCSGDVIPGTNLFNQRIVIFSELVSS